MSDHATFRLAMTVLDTLISAAGPGAEPEEGEATWRPDGQLELWDSILPHEVRGPACDLLKTIGARHARRSRLGTIVVVFEIPPEAVEWIEATAEANGDRLRPQEHGAFETVRF